MNCNRLARSQSDFLFDSIYVVGDKAYWAAGAVISTSSVSAPTGFNTTIADVSTVNSNSMKVSALSVTDTKAYFADKPIESDKDPTHSGNVYQAALMENAPVTTMARGQKAASSIVTDAMNVYWATGDCAIMSMPK